MKSNSRQSSRMCGPNISAFIDMIGESETSSRDTLSSRQVWHEIRARLENQFDPHIFQAFIKPLKFINLDLGRGEIVLTSPSKLVSSRIENGLSENIVRAAASAIGRPGLELKLNLRFEAGAESESAAPFPHVVVKKLKSAQPVAIDHRLYPFNETTVNPKYTFANFVVGSSNQFCHAAAMRVSEEPGLSYNPLFIYGGVGLGKTHLLHAIGNAVLSKRPNARVLYISSEAFTNELIRSLRLAKMDEFKQRFRNIEVLLVDDIQFMCGKERTQEEFFHTFNVLHSAKHQIVVTSDKVPQEIPGIEERLQTRFSWGLTADLQAPDLETRVAILTRKAANEGLAISPEVINYVAEKFSSNIRELEGAYTRLHALASLQNGPVSLEAAINTLKALLQPRAIRVTVSDIKKVVATHFSIRISDMESKRRTRNLSFPRHICMYLCRKHTTCSYPEIGSYFGNRDHSSVIHAASVVASKVESDTSVRALVGEIERILLEP